VSSAFRGQAENARKPGAQRFPMAEVSRSVLARNAAASGATTYEPSLLRADAWGHGAAVVEEVLSDAGILPASAGALQASTMFGLAANDQTTPAMRLRGVVLATKALRAGEGVSYGYLYRAPVDTRIALVTGGYGQGVVRSLGGVADVSVGGHRYPIIGRVAMDVCVVEISDAAIRRGDEGVFFGDPAAGEPSVHEWRTATGLTVAELVTAVGLHSNRQVAL
jgi:alanine racemase